MTLSETWFMDGFIDFELQKYRLLAYLQEVNKCFDETRLYPQLSDVIFHYNNLVAFRDSKKLLESRFPKDLTMVNVEKLELTYKQMLEDDELMQELERITEFGINHINSTIANGTEIYELVEKQLHIAPVGILPLYKDEGYLLLTHGKRDVNAYAYTMTLFEHKQARYRGIKIKLVDKFVRSIANTYEQMKLNIIKSMRTMPTPAVYLIESQLTVPIDETLLPIAKRMLVRQLAAA
jgi:hypothetical protein